MGILNLWISVCVMILSVVINNEFEDPVVFYVRVSVHHKSISYKEPTRCNFGSIVY
jgi:hypothetical protein